MQKNEIEKQLGFSISDICFEKGRKAAELKLKMLISRFGDHDGERNTKWYFECLVVEECRTEALSEATFYVAKSMLDMEKEYMANANVPL